jgi:hypothetical protein
MPFAPVPNSSYLDLFGYRITSQTTVEAAYGMSQADITAPGSGVNVALVLPRASQPTFLAEDWATRQQTLSQYNSDALWKTFGAGAQFDVVEKQVQDLGLKVIGSSDPTGTS